MNNLDKRILEITKVYDNNGETYDRYTVFTPDGAVYGMSEGGEGFNQYIGDYTEIEMGEHLGTKLDSVPESIKNAVLNRMVDSQFVDLIQYYELMPENVSATFNMYYEMNDNEWSYDSLSKLQSELKELGYTFDYGLDAEPYGLRPIELSLNQLKDFEEEFEKGGSVYNKGRSWHLDRQKHNKSESWEKPMRKRKKRYETGGGVGDFKNDGHGNYTNDEGYSLIDQFDGTYQVLDADGMDIVGEYISFEDGKRAIKDYMEENEKYSKGGGINSGREAMFKSQEPHEQKYKRKREWKEYKKEGWFGDWFRDGGSMDDYTKSLGMVRVKFAYPKYNYETNVSGSITEEQARNYFVGKMFDVGVYPNQNMQRVIDIDFYPKGTYESGGGVGEAKTYKINNTTAIEAELNKFLHSLKLKDGYSNSMGTFTAKLTLEQFNKLVALIIGYDKNDNVYILDSVNNVVYDSKDARMKRKEMFKNYANGGGVSKKDEMYQESKWLTKEQWEKWRDYVRTGKIDGKKENNIFAVARWVGAPVAKINAYEIEQRAKKYKNYATGGGVGNFSEYSNDALTDAIINLSRFENTEDDIQTLKEELKKRKESIKLDSEEEMVKSNLYNGEISCEKLTEIIGCKPNYPYQIVGAIKLEKCYLRPYYKLV